MSSRRLGDLYATDRLADAPAGLLERRRQVDLRRAIGRGEIAAADAAAIDSEAGKAAELHFSACVTAIAAVATVRPCVSTGLPSILTTSTASPVSIA